MLLQALTVKNDRGSLLALPLSDISGGFVVREIQGLGPVKAVLVSSSFANLDGEQYHSSRLGPRNILLKLGIEPNYSEESTHDLRERLYQYFMPQSEITLVFNLFDKFSGSVVDQVLDLEIVGRVESSETNLFTREPTIDISIMCYAPAFVDPRIILFESDTVADLTEVEVFYRGTTPTGFEFKLFPDRTVDEFMIYHRPAHGALYTVHYTDQLLAGDELTISSSVGDKRVIRKRAGVETSQLFSLSPQSAWLNMCPGSCHFRVYATGTPVPYSIEYTEKYGGL